MKLSRAEAKENLAKLVEKFEKETSSGRINDYNEEATKTAFIQPFLRNVLGWNVSNRDEVSPEERTSRGRVDYGLKIQDQIKLFIEVKPPRADLDKHIKQAVGYGYNRKGVPFVLLTDFEGLKLFDVTIKPDTRNPLKGLKIDLDWKEYLSKFDKIWLLSKESVLNGELDKLLLKKPKDRLPVDKAILDDLKKWREKLAKDIFKNNSELFHSPLPSLPLMKESSSSTSSPLMPACAVHADRGEDKGGGANYLKEITQRIIDRIMFMRSCEDRKLIHRRSLRELFEERTEIVGTNTMVFLKEEFKHYNIIFDSDLFRPQDWEANLAIDFKVMKDIILDTYNPYQFDVIPLEVLGNMYEQYLGYTIRLTDHQVKYELKPDVRKAGGVYYTPEYIVDYIVKNTVGKLLQELPANRFLSFRPRTRFGEGISSKTKKLRILDPACGSGSFLIRAYEEMLNYYKNQKKTKSHAKSRKCHSEPCPELVSWVGSESQQLIKHEAQEPILTIEEKARILQEHIFGVDIDEQAVEVTKLSLMLKMLEGEFGIIPGRSILPMLDKNIRCGNSLISGDTLELKKYFGDDWYKVKAFNWKDAFRKIMVEEGGFDVVIGNPPYVLLQDTFRNNAVLEFVRNTYEVASYKIDTYHLFIEQGIKLLKTKGRISFITPSNFLTNNYLIPLREFILNKTEIAEINTIDNLVFEQASVNTTVFVFEKSTMKEKDKMAVFRTWTIDNACIAKTTEVIFPQKELRHSSELLFKFSKSEPLLKKIEGKSLRLLTLATVNFGMQLRDRKIFLNDVVKIKNKNDKARLTKKHKACLTGKNIGRYYTCFSEMYCLEDLSAKRGGCWNLNIHHTKNKIVIRQIGKYPVCSLDEEGRNCLNTVFMVVPKRDINVYFLLGILSSKLIQFYWQNRFYDQRKTFPKIKGTYLLQLPIRLFNVHKSNEKKHHDDLVALVDVMLDLNKKIQTVRGSRKDQIQRQIEKTDKEIDVIVYKLYGLTKEEIEIIESNV